MSLKNSKRLYKYYMSLADGTIPRPPGRTGWSDVIADAKINADRVADRARLFYDKKGNPKSPKQLGDYAHNSQNYEDPKDSYDITKGGK